MLNGLIDCYKRGEVAFGSWFANGDYSAARAAGDSLADYVVIDMEHVGYDFPDLGVTMQWLQNRRNSVRPAMTATPIVRIPANAEERNEWMHKQVLDYGALGVLLPHTSTPEDAAFAVTATRYPQGRDAQGPVGRRGAFPQYAMRYWGVESAEEYLTRADHWRLNEDGEIVLMILVEDYSAWERIDELVAVPGVGAVVWGPADGALSLGIKDSGPDDPRLDSYRRAVIDACKAAGVPVGTPGGDPRRAIDDGFDFVSVQGMFLPGQLESLREYAGRA